MALGAALYMLAVLFVPQMIHGYTTESVMWPGNTWMDFWLVKLGLNLLGYATIFVPAAIIIRHLKKIKYNEQARSTYFSQLVKMCVFGNESDSSTMEGGGILAKLVAPDETWTLFQKFVVLIFCFFGLQCFYLTWGILQERIMTFEYGKVGSATGEFFKNSTFLVFMNRISAFCIASLAILIRKQPQHTSPLYKYSYSSFSNIMSSWCQYEALKFVSFPTQVLAKASKIIPVMIMGKFVGKKTYEFHEYLTAAMISVGISLFLLTSGDVTRRKDTVTTFSGIVLLVGYMLFDSFTSNWQGALFTQYRMSSVQMMAGVNMFSCILTTVALVEQGGFVESMAFMARNPNFIFHVTILSICSATGQLFIFYTISVFGPVTFTIIMTVRQGFAIFLSCLIYGHPVTFIGVLGIIVVFLALFLRIYVNKRKRSASKRTSKESSSSLVNEVLKV